jgi:hypothetical protein
MDQLDGHRAGDDVIGGRTGTAGHTGTDGEERPQSFPAGADQVGGHIGEERILRPHRRPQRLFDPFEIGRQRGQTKRRSEFSGVPGAHPGQGSSDTLERICTWSGQLRYGPRHASGTLR